MKKILKLLVKGMSNCYTPALDNYYMIHRSSSPNSRTIRPWRRA